MGSGAWHLLHHRVPPSSDVEPPAVSTAGLDSAVARLIESSTAAVRATPRAGAAWGRLGSVLVTHGFHAEASLAFEQAERLSPGDARWAYRRALVMIDQGETPEIIIAKLQAAVALCGDQPDMPRLRLAQYLLEQGRLDQSEQEFRHLLKILPTHPPALLGMARIRLAQGRPTESLDYLERCTEAPQAARSAQLLLAQVHQRLGNATAAEAAARRGASLSQDLPWPDPYMSELAEVMVGKHGLMEQAQQLIEAGRFIEALSALGQVTNDYPHDPEALYGIGLILNRQQRSAEAESILREQVRLAPDSAHGHEQLAAALMAQKRYAEAVPVLERAVQLMPTLAKAHFGLGYACSRLGKPAEAIIHLRAAVLHNPKDADSYSLLADLLSTQDRFSEAADALRHLVQLRPNWGRAHFNLGYVQARLGHSDQAISHLRDALRFATNDMDSHVLLAELLSRQGETNEATALLRKAQALDPKDDRAASLLKTLGTGK